MSGSAPGGKKSPRRGSLAWWVAEHQPPASVPVVARRRWMVVVKFWVKSPAGLTILKSALIRPETFLVVAEAISRRCTGSTGRNIGATNATLAAAAGRSEATVTRVRKVLLDNGFLYRSVGGVSGGRGCHARPAIDHLTARREHSTVSTAAARRNPPPKRRTRSRPVKSASAEHISAEQAPVDNSRQLMGDGEKMTSLSVVNPVGNKSLVTLVVDNQSASARFTPAGGGSKKPLKAGRFVCDRARPLKPATQRRRWWLSYAAADVLVVRMNGFTDDTRSAVASALYLSHLDLEAWYAEGGGPAIVRALNVHAPSSRGRGDKVYRWDWPNTITSPGGFLAMRLQHLPARPETVGVPAGASAVIAKLALGPGSTSAARAAARNQFKEAQAHRAAQKRGAGVGQVSA